MYKLGRIAIYFIIAACSAGALVAAGPGLNKRAQFTSAYTDLKTECKNAFKDVGEGQDMPLMCKGYGGYKIYIYYSAWAANIALAQPTKSDRIGDTMFLAMQGLSYDQEGRKVEWRMADGKPFAVIMRVTDYKETNDGDNPFDEKNRTGESLIIKGLKGFERIDSRIDAKTPDANAKAREIADSNYNKR
jgi:hypothetical protein